MDLNYQQHIPADFPAESRVWIYQSSRIFSIPEALEMEQHIEAFITDWQTHGAANKGYANLFFGQFLVVMADETNQKISGCSTDSSVRFIKGIEKRYSVNMFDRQSLAFIIKDKVQLLPLAQLNYAFENKFIDTDTLYFNNLVTTKEEWLNNWIIPVKNSWLKARLPLQAL